MKNNSELTGKMLDWCQDYLRSLEGYREGSMYTEDQSRLPQEALIRLMKRGDVPDPRSMKGTYEDVCRARGMRHNHDVDETEKMWIVDQNGIKEILSIDESILLGTTKDTENRYYTVPEFFIGYENNGEEAFIDAELGPWDAIGFTLPIETDSAGNRSFGIPTDAWAM